MEGGLSLLLLLQLAMVSTAAAVASTRPRLLRECPPDFDTLVEPLPAAVGQPVLLTAPDVRLRTVGFLQDTDLRVEPGRLLLNSSLQDLGLGPFSGPHVLLCSDNKQKLVTFSLFFRLPNTTPLAAQQPTQQPAQQPIQQPTQQPTQLATQQSTQQPAQQPIQQPTQQPTQPPTQQPIQQPTQPPTQQPTQQPTQPPTQQPTQQPTQPPTQQPTQQPTQPPTQQPTQQPTQPPTQQPTQDLRYFLKDPLVLALSAAVLLLALLSASLAALACHLLRSRRPRRPIYTGSQHLLPRQSAKLDFSAVNLVPAADAE